MMGIYKSVDAAARKSEYKNNKLYGCDFRTRKLGIPTMEKKASDMARLRIEAINEMLKEKDDDGKVVTVAYPYSASKSYSSTDSYSKRYYTSPDRMEMIFW